MTSVVLPPKFHILGGFWGVFGRTVWGHQPLRHSRETCHHNAEGHPAGASYSRWEGLRGSGSGTESFSNRIRTIRRKKRIVCNEPGNMPDVKTLPFCLISVSLLFFLFHYYCSLFWHSNIMFFTELYNLLLLGSPSSTNVMLASRLD